MTESIKSHKYACPSCGGYMVYSPKAQCLVCEYCQTEMQVEVEDKQIEEYDLFSIDELRLHNWGQEKRVINCNSCGGQTVIDITEVTSNCVFCGSAQVVTDTMDEGISPESVIPFKIDRQSARANITKWLKSKFYAPKALKSKQSLDKLKSLYVPFFTYDSDTHTEFTCQVGHYYYVTVRRNGKSVRERRIRWRRESGTIDRYYNDILINASKKVDDNLITQMHSFDLDALKPYDEGFLVGHITERYNKNLTEGWDESKGEIKRDLTERIRKQVGGDKVKNIDLYTKYDNVLFKHILLPIWITAFTYKNKLYNVYINGQNGRVVGKYPKSLGKILLTVLGIALIALIIYQIFINQGVSF